VTRAWRWPPTPT